MKLEDLSLENIRVDLSKISHPQINKTLGVHIKEVEEISKKIAEKLGIKDEWNLLHLLAKYHDIGKLHIDWPEKKKIIRHAIIGSIYLWKKRNSKNVVFLKEFTDVDELLKAILLNLIRIHHSFYRIQQFLENEYGTPSPEDEMLEEDELESYTNFLAQAYRKITNEIIDLYGCFKIADILSASGMERIDIFPTIDVNINWKELDENRLEKQIRAATYDILIAPTGWGKTIAAILKMRNSPGRTFYLLPTITAISKMEEKFVRYLGENVGSFYYFFDAKLALEEEIEDEEFEEKFKKSRYFLYPINITTYQQVLISLAKLRSDYPITRVFLRNSLLIMDEFHLVDPKVLAVFLELVKTYNEELGYNIKMYLMSATPSIYHRELSKRYGLKVYEERLTNVRNVGILVFPEDYLKEYLKAVDIAKTGKNVLVLVNKPETAVEVFSEIEKTYKNTLLLHGRFAFCDRKRIEAELFRRIKNHKGLIFVSTQVAEVSLDVSFDCGFLQVAPLPSLIQRLGRINRHIDKNGGVNKMGIKNTFRIICHGLKERVYSRDQLERTINEIEPYGRITDVELVERMAYWISKREVAYLGGKGEIERIVRRVFRSYLCKETDILKFDTELVVPDYYKGKKEELIKKLEREDNFEKKRRILAEIKKYMVPVRRGLLESGEPIYHPKYGLVDREKIPASIL